MVVGCGSAGSPFSPLKELLVGVIESGVMGSNIELNSICLPGWDVVNDDGRRCSHMGLAQT